jgi:Family of unknown function (DUF5681)
MSKEGFADDYEVGYGKPPKNSQFPKGTSGNPTGRPKKARDLGATLLREANSPITIVESGQKVRLSKHEVAVKMFMNNVMKGKPSDLRLYFAQYPQALDKVLLAAQQAKNEKDKNVKDLSDEMLAQIIARGRRRRLESQRIAESKAKGDPSTPREVGTA